MRACQRIMSAVLVSDQTGGAAAATHFEGTNQGMANATPPGASAQNTGSPPARHAVKRSSGRTPTTATTTACAHMPATPTAKGRCHRHEAPPTPIRVAVLELLVLRGQKLHGAVLSMAAPAALDVRLLRGRTLQLHLRPSTVGQTRPRFTTSRRCRRYRRQRSGQGQASRVSGSTTANPAPVHLGQRDRRQRDR